MYCVERIDAEIPVEEYLRDYVDVNIFTEVCQDCPKYNKIWTCPPYTFAPEEYWAQYNSFHIIGSKIIFDAEILERTYTPEEMKNFLESTVFIEKQKLTKELYEMERMEAGSMSISAGSCMICGQEGCTRLQGEPCKYPDKMRYSIESLGGNVGKTCSKLLGVELEWITEGKLPAHFMLVCGLLKI